MYFPVVRIYLWSTIDLLSSPRMYVRDVSSHVGSMKFHTFRSANGPYIDHRYREYTLEKYLTFGWYSNLYTRFLKSTNCGLLLVQSVLADSQKMSDTESSVFRIDRRGMQKRDEQGRNVAASPLCRCECVRRGYGKSQFRHIEPAQRVLYVREKWVCGMSHRGGGGGGRDQPASHPKKTISSLLERLGGQDVAETGTRSSRQIEF